MPFCMAALIITISLSEIVTLQVRIPKENVATLFYGCQRRKAFLSVSENSASETGSHTGTVMASMTLEAAIVLSLLIFASVSLILPMKILNTERKIQAGLEAVGEDFTRYAYIQDSILKGDDSAVKGADEFAKAFCHYLGEGVAEGYVQERVMEHIDTGAIRQVTMVRSEIMEDGEHFDLILDYCIQMPFPVLGLSAVRRTARCRRRAWIGREGKDGPGSGNSENLKDEIVYVEKAVRGITETGTAIIWRINWLQCRMSRWLTDETETEGNTMPAPFAESRLVREAPFTFCRREAVITRRRFVLRFWHMCGRYGCQRSNIWDRVPIAASENEKLGYDERGACLVWNDGYLLVFCCLQRRRI